MLHEIHFSLLKRQWLDLKILQDLVGANQVVDEAVERCKRLMFSFGSIHVLEDLSAKSYKFAVISWECSENIVHALLFAIH